MKYVRFKQGNQVGFGVLNGKGSIRVLEGAMFDGPRPTNITVPIADVKLLPPCDASAMIALWNNSKVQIAKLNRETPREVLYFLKPRSCLATHGDEIIYPHGQTERVVMEGELGIVIGRVCKGISAEEARNYIFGYTVVNDVTAQDTVGRDKTFPQYTRGKGFDTFGIFGPAIETGVNPMELTIQSFLNGELCQDYPVTDLAFNPFQIVALLSHNMTLHPGDIIACGTSLGVQPMSCGDTVEIKIAGIGTLTNRVALQ